MGWTGWILVLALFILPLALLCFSVASTSIEIRKKTQPSVDSFFDALYTVMFRHPRNDNTSSKSKPN